MKRKNKRCDANFKRKALELNYERRNVVEIEEELGISPQMLYRWRAEAKQYKHNSFPEDHELQHGTSRHNLNNNV